jgi:hypothetical protein
MHGGGRADTLCVAAVALEGKAMALRVLTDRATCNSNNEHSWFDFLVPGIPNFVLTVWI